MKTARAIRQPPAGYALVLVLLFMGASTLMLAGVMDWIATRARLTQRQQSYQAALAAAESSATKAISAITADYLQNRESYVAGRISSVYETLTPKPAEDDAWARFRFFDANGVLDRVTVSRLGDFQYGDLHTRYQGLRGYFTPYRVTAGASVESVPGVRVGALVQYDLHLASIPVFALQGFSAMDLEICPSTSVAFTGRVHANGDLYVNPSQCTVIFRNHVTAAGQVVNGKHPDDPVTRTGGLVSYQKSYDSGARALRFRTGPAHSPALLRALIEKPPPSESPSSLLGRLRYYNLADLVITVDDSGVRAASGASSGFAVTFPPEQITPFVSTNRILYDKRESRQVQLVQIDVGAFIAQMPSLRSTLGWDVSTIYVANERSAAPDTINGVVLTNGATLPATGLTVATPNPLYVQGHYNAAPAHLGTTNTTLTKPAALAADAVTILSGNWQDANSTLPLASRLAASTTVNAGIITGNVPTGGGFYSGGYENLLRLLEDWTSQTLTFNGSLALLYPSLIAASPWGALDDVYTPPRRNFSWDGNFQVDSLIPPRTPRLRAVFWSKYTVLPVTAP